MFLPALSHAGRDVRVQDPVLELANIVHPERAAESALRLPPPPWAVGPMLSDPAFLQVCRVAELLPNVRLIVHGRKFVGCVRRAIPRTSQICVRAVIKIRLLQKPQS